MARMIFAPETGFDFEKVPTGLIVSRCLLAAFVILAIGCAFSQMWRIRRRLSWLNEEPRARQAYEEHLAGIGAKPAPSRNTRDPWQD